MKAEPTEDIRIIIQFIRAQVPGYSRYRLVAYGAEQFQPAESFSFAELAQRFESAGIPEQNRPKQPHQELLATTIVLAQNLALTPTQLKILGLGK